ncbi:hypothetical protein [Legionella spiritensis]|uniref:hypothetical protein n=1 Tax=Legionella spiritensis TaxID=452 RepID=UPI000F6ED24C|nr:hypothetical protein [Legionella spiritensis]VEG91491.1 Uncharacterised protein [Legionella spiritensis]
MPGAIIESLLSSVTPHRFLLHVGLTREQYRQTSAVSGEEKQALARKIVDQGGDREVLAIIEALAKLEFSVDRNNPVRAGNRLLAQVMRAYLARHEEERFNQYYQKQGKARLAEYKIAPEIKTMWAIINSAAETTLLPRQYEQFLEQGYQIIPLFHYEQLLPDITDEQFMRGERYDLIKDKALVAAFNEQLTADVETVDWQPDTDSLADTIGNIQAHILLTKWKVGGVWFFSGGVEHEGRRLPHRVYEMLERINLWQGNSRATEEETRQLYRDLVEIAKEAIDHPRSGRDGGTTAFYQAIFTHRVLDERYPFYGEEPDDGQPDEKTLLLL